MKEHASGRRIRLPFVILVVVVLLGAAWTVRTRGSLRATTTGLNVVYIESNEGSVTNMNGVFGWTNSGGTLTPITGSPFLTGGTGVYDPGEAKGKSEFAADGQVIISPKNNVLYAVNGHSNTFAAFTINTTTGALTALPGSPYNSEGTDPVSFGYLYNVLDKGTESWLGVVNKAQDPGCTGTCKPVINVAPFKVDAAGVPVFLGTSALVSLTQGTSPSQLATLNGSAQGKGPLHWALLDQYLTSGTDFAGLYEYSVSGQGKLTASGSAQNPVDPATFGVAVNPAFRVIYSGFPTLNEVGVFFYSSTTGALTWSAAYPGGKTAKGQSWMVVGPPSIGKGGSFLYTSDVASSEISVFSITFDGTNLSDVQDFTLSGTGTVPGNLAFDPTGAYLYCLDNVHAMLHVLAIDSKTGMLTEPNAPIAINVPAGEEPLGIATAML